MTGAGCAHVAITGYLVVVCRFFRKKSYASAKKRSRIGKEFLEWNRKDDGQHVTEDHRFYKHNGIDIIAIGRATINDIKAMSFVEGGSTITQQLSKNIYFTQEKKITRKIAEVFMSFEIEKNYNKDEILELYLNTSYFGEGCYTVKEASRKYFGKEPKKMTDYEAIMLAGIPNAPSVYSLTKNPELAKQRQKQVINKMIEYKYLTQSEADKILEQ